MRFEVLKRDKFTCQYCGAGAPDVLLHIDHLMPVAEGGATEILNLVAVCVSCNLGKGARLLSDDAAIKKQRVAIDVLAERREQMEMMLRWRNDLAALNEDTVTCFCKVFHAGTGLFVHTGGRVEITKWLRTYDLDELLSALDISVSQYVRGRTQKEAERCFWTIPAIASARRRPDAEVKRWAAYISAILRNQINHTPRVTLRIVESILRAGLSVDQAKDCARHARSWPHFLGMIDNETGQK
jgi:hypothetical protein